MYIQHSSLFDLKKTKTKQQHSNSRQISVNAGFCLYTRPYVLAEQVKFTGITTFQ